MKKFAAFALSTIAATGVFANIISWDFDTISDPDSLEAIDMTQYQVVFVTGTGVTDGKVDGANVNGGSNTDYAVYNGAPYGTWEDKLDPTPVPNYYVALMNSDGTSFFAIDDGTGNPLRYEYSASSSIDGPALPNAGEGSFSPDTPSGGFKTMTPVPEPATAVLALAGIAMLIRRRKA